MSRLNDNKGFLFNEGFAIVKGDKVAARSGSRIFSRHPRSTRCTTCRSAKAPTNVKAKAAADIADVFYKPDELARYAYIADFAYMASQVDGWAKRWETEIAPLLRT